MDAELHKAIQHGSVSNVEELLQKGTSINNLFGMKGTPLCAAIYAKQPLMVDYLVQHKCDINAKDFDGEPPLCLAIRMDFFDIANKLIDNSSCDVNKRDPISGQRPIHICVNKGQYDLMVSLLQHKCDINSVDSKGNTALHLAVVQNENVIAKYLIKQGCDVYKSDGAGHMVIHTCITKHNTTILSILLEETKNKDSISKVGDFIIDDIPNKYINIGTKGYCDTPLILAVREENFPAVCELIKYHCDLNMSNNQGDSPLYLACKLNRSDIASCLLQSGANPNNFTTVSKLQGEEELIQKSPIHESVCMGNLPLVQKLIEHGALINIKDSIGETALHLALKKNKPDIADYLITIGPKKGLDINTETSLGRNLLFATASCSKPDYFAKRLLSLGCHVNHIAKPVSDVVSPLQCAVDMACTPLVEVLLENGASTEVYDSSGYTPLHFCAIEDMVGVAASLIQWGADLNAQSRCDEDNETSKYDEYSKNGLYEEDSESESDESESNDSNDPSVSSIKAYTTPLGTAIDSGSYEFARFILDCGCFVSEQLKSYLQEKDVFFEEELRYTIEKAVFHSRNPLSLRMSCRNVIIRHIRVHQGNVLQLPKLPLPKKLIDFLRYKELDQYKYM